MKSNIKVFSVSSVALNDASADDLNDKLSEWLDDNPSYEVVDFKLTSNNNCVVLGVKYTDRSMGL